MKELTVIDGCTLVIIDTLNYGAAIASLQKSMAQCSFDKVLFLTDITLEIEGVEIKIIPKINSKNEYSHFTIKELWKYIDTEHVIISQHDSWILEGELFPFELYNYDYAGALWLETDGLANGNGGMSWRSKKLLEATGKDDFVNATTPEDVALCRVYRAYLEINYGLRWATDEICEQFSFELREPVRHTFAFHSYFWNKFKDHVVIIRKNSMGDVVMCEPILTYYHEKGYQVVLDTLPEMMPIFFNNPYKIKHISEMNPSIKPIKVINLDMAYESKPKQNVLKTYYEFAGITDGVMRNSRLHVNQQPQQRLFNKFIVFHISDTGMTHRNCYGVNWQFVDSYYQRLGYTCIQVCGGEPVGIWFNAETKPMLMFLLRGADAVCAIDSGIAQLSVALGVPTAIFFGSINPKLRYQDFSKIEPIRTGCPNKELEYCYHNVDSSTVGNKCVIDEGQPPCCVFNEYQVIDALNKLLKLK